MSFVERPRFSCMLGGVLATISSLPRTVPIVHGAQGCGTNLSNTFGQGGYLGGGYCGGLSVPSSNTGDTEIIFGGTDRLAKQIETTFDVIDADLFVVTTACMTDIIGDDVKTVINELEGEHPPIVFIEAGGFKGDSYYGYAKFMEELFRQYIPKGKTDLRRVNLLGLVPGYDPFFRGDLEELRRLLELVGVTATTFLTPDQNLDDIKKSGEAALNIVFNRGHGPELGQAVKDSHGIDYWLTDLPIGGQASAAFLKEVGQRLGLDGHIVEAAIKKEAERYYQYVDRLSALVVDFDFQNYAVVVANSTEALPYALYLDNEIGWLVTSIFITDQLSDEQKEALKQRFEELTFAEKPELVFETDTFKIQSHLEVSRPQFLSDTYYEKIEPLFILGATLESTFAESLNGFLLPVSYPIINRTVIARGYAGYNGGLNLLGDLADAQVAKRI